MDPSNIGVPFLRRGSPHVFRICVDSGRELNLVCSIIGLESIAWYS